VYRGCAGLDLRRHEYAVGVCALPVHLAVDQIGAAGEAQLTLWLRGRPKKYATLPVFQFGAGKVIPAAPQLGRSHDRPAAHLPVLDSSGAGAVTLIGALMLTLQ
jgi:hypothetical protein